MTVTVTTKEELEKAVNDKVDEIIVVGELAEKLKKTQKMQNMSGAGLKALAVAASVAAGAVVTAPATGGLSSFAGFAAVGGAAVMTGTSVVVIVAIVTTGLVLLTAMYKDYDLMAECGDKKVVLKKRQAA